MRNSSLSLPEMVADAVLQQYHSLPRTGKPQPNEHTVLAGFAVSLCAPQGRADTCAGYLGHDAGEESLSTKALCGQHLRVVCVALGTGTKCVGARQSKAHVDVVNDSHAEVRDACHESADIFHKFLCGCWLAA